MSKWRKGGMTQSKLFRGSDLADKTHDNDFIASLSLAISNQFFCLSECIIFKNIVEVLNFVLQPEGGRYFSATCSLLKLTQFYNPVWKIWDFPFSTYTEFSEKTSISYPEWYAHVNFSENFTYVLNVWLLWYWCAKYHIHLYIYIYIYLDFSRKKFLKKLRHTMNSASQTADTRKSWIIVIQHLQI